MPSNPLPLGRRILAAALLLPAFAVAACEPVPESATRNLDRDTSPPASGSLSAGTAATNTNGSRAAATPLAKATPLAGGPDQAKTAIPATGGSSTTPSTTGDAGAVAGGRLGPIARNATATALAKAGGQAAAPSGSITATARTASIASAPRSSSPTAIAAGSRSSGGADLGSTPSSSGLSRGTATASSGARAIGSGPAATPTTAGGSAVARATATNVPVADPGGYLGRSATLGSPGATGSVAAVRYGVHPEDGFTRVVWDLAATQMPLVTVAQKSDASGAFIELVFDGTSMGATAAASLPLEFASGAAGVVTQVDLAPDGNTSHLVFHMRLARPARFQVGALDSPWRAVVDVYE